MLFLRIILISFICLSFSSCKESEKERIARLFSEWDGKEVKFPAHPVFTAQGKDTVNFDYRQKIMDGDRPKNDASVTEVSVDRTEHDFGTFPKVEKQEYTFRLTNVGQSLLAIQDVTTSCGCTKVEYRKEPVRPGESLELKVIYEAEESGHFNKVITAFANVKNSPLRLRIMGCSE